MSLVPSLASTAGRLACRGSILRLIQLENNEQLTLVPDTVRFLPVDLRNVSDRRRWTWRNDHPKALFFHGSLLHHGYRLVMIRDAVGTVVDSTQLEWAVDAVTEPGVPGDWTIDLIRSTGRGRVDWSLTGVTADSSVAGAQ
jgi:hypothetical protein